MSDAPTPSAAPPLAHRSELLHAAWSFAEEAHRGQRRKGGNAPYIEHPSEVARLVDEYGAGDDAILAAAFLHDVVEDSDATLGEVRERFGDDVGGHVEAITEDQALEPYVARKEHHRDQVEAAGPQATAIYVADKLVNLRDLRKLYDEVGERASENFNSSIATRIELWWGDVEMGQRVVPNFRPVSLLRDELTAFERTRAGVP
jgi:(p)ppGpp synthase/HD superfamily hydrolase